MEFLLEKRRFLVLGFFGVLLLVGILSFGDVGISWDEKTQYALGRNVYETVVNSAEWPTDPGRRFHGPFFEFILYGLGEILPLPHARAIFQMRHFVNFLSFFVGVLFFYLLAARHFRSWRWGLLGALLLVISPRIFGHAFFNSRDIPALSLFAVSVYTLVRFLDRKTIGNALLHALACAILMSVRMTGMLLPVLTAFFLLFDSVREFRRGFVPIPRYAFLLLIFFVGWITLTIAFWPLLWEGPVQNFLAAYQNMSNKAPGGFYMGESLSSTPWHWIPVWIFISTPILYTLFFLGGLAFSSREIIRAPLQRRNDLLFLAWFFLPILAVLILKAGIFDTWRHVFFIYPAFLLIALTGVKWLWESSLKYARRITAALLIVSLGWTSFWMVRHHPLQYVYFSLPSSLVEGKFELDYWGLSYRRGLEYVLEQDSSPVISVYFSGSSGFSSINLLTPEQRTRLRFAKNMEAAMYILDNFKWKGYQETISPELKIHSIEVDGMEILAIYRNPGWDPVDLQEAPLLPTERVFFLFPGSFLKTAPGADVPFETGDGGIVGVVF